MTTVGPDDRRYADLVRGFNQRWVGRPDRVVVARSANDVVAAVQRAVDEGKRLTVRSGGHCYEDFVVEPDVRVIIDLAELTSIEFDPARRAIAIEPGAELGAVYEALFRRWGVTLPGGSCPTVGIGGHVAGGGYGPLCRLHGLVSDHLYAVEVVTVNRRGTARRVVATREPADPNRDLWWAHTGGGGGSFGVVTKYWFRQPDVSATDDPARLLPRPPHEVWLSSVSWAWSAMSEESFVRLLTNYGRWHEHNSDAGSPYAGMFSRLNPATRTAGTINLATQFDTAAPNSAALLDRFLAEVNAGVGVTPVVLERRRLPWLHATTWTGLFSGDSTSRCDFKSSYLRRAPTTSQILALHHHLTRPDYHHPAAFVSIASYGGRTNTVAPADTATAQRDSVLKLLYVVGWTDPAQDTTHIQWLREMYRDIHADTGGVPVPNDVTDGCFVNYPDTDLGDPEWNTSGTDWSTLYYKDNYPRLRQVKLRWDPLDVFHHAQSVRLPQT
jgi:hypothetical protein